MGLAVEDAVKTSGVKRITGHEYINDFLYFVIRPENRGGKDVLICCSGINLDRFSPITRGRYGIGGNPVKSGLQVVNYDICSLATSKGATPRVITGNDCAGIAPTKDLWYAEILQIENYSNLLPDEIISYGVRSLAQKIVHCSRLDYQLPDKLLAPEDLQVYLDTICKEMPISAWKS
jgi:hypothetical protein